MSTKIEKLQEMLTHHEGKRSKPYRDTLGNMTAGIGRNIDAVPFSEDEIQLMLMNDIYGAEKDLSKNFPWFNKLDDIRWCALMDMRFNLGMTRLLGFKKFLEAMEAQEWDEAANEMLRSVWAQQVGNRAVELSEMIRKG